MLFALESLSGLFAKFIDKVYSEKGWWYRLPLNKNTSHYDTDSVLPSVSKLLNLPDTAIRVIFSQVRICKWSKDREKSEINRKGIDDFKGINQFSNANVEVTLCKFGGKRFFFIRLGKCELSPESI